MTNNDSLRSIRFTFNLSDSKMIEIFSLVEQKVTREEVSNWLKKEDHPDYESLKGDEFSNFLNGFIIKKRGRKEGPLPKPDKWMTNNLVMKKLKIALNLKSDDIKNILELTGLSMSDHELSAFFRKPDHKNFRTCQDQVLRSFLKGIQLKYRPETEVSKT